MLLLTGHGIRVCAIVKNKSDLLSEIRKADQEAENRKKMAKPKNVPLPLPSSQISASHGSVEDVGTFRMEGYAPRKRKAIGSSPLDKAFNQSVREHLHSLIARMFYSAGLPFHLARNPYFVDAFQYAAENQIVGYVPPGYNLLRTTLLQKERANIERLLEPTKKSWDEKGLSIVSDGWTDAHRRPLINFMAACNGGAMFIKAVNCEGETKDKYHIAKLISEVIDEVGPTNVIQVITDNAPVCSAAGSIIQGNYPKIFWTPCVVHTLNLALKNICAAKEIGVAAYAYDECHWITTVIDDVMFVKNFIMNHSMRLAIFNEFVPLKLLSVADTRFASAIVMLKRFKLIYHGLQTMVISDKWASYKEDDVGKASVVKEKLLNDVWWDKIEYILSFTLPIYEMLRFCDTDKPCLHLVYEMWDSMIERVKTSIYRREGKSENEESSFYSIVHQILVERWTKSSTPLHCLAHSLNPRYYSGMWLHENPIRVPPHKDVEISEMRIKCFKRYFPDSDERRVVNTEYAKFSGCLESFGDSDSICDRGVMEPVVWWLAHGSSAPTLQSLAVKLLSQPCSSSCCERNWSTYSFIHSMRRNKMTPQRCEDLVFVHSNIRLLSRRSQLYTEGETKLWDVGGDAFDSLEGSGFLEIANLSLDEPEIEAVLFNDEVDGSEL
ncbi:unnamed protein product [Camellia sinensis]